jgi:hypothetical protein
MKAVMKKFLFISSCGLMALLAGCSEEPGAGARKTKAPEPVSGQSALYKMYQVARSWAPDVEVLKLNSIHLTEVPAVRGKAGAWQATFTSTAKGAARSYTYSVIEGEGNLHEGVFPGPQESWSGPSEKPFLVAAVKVDSDAAYKAALKEAGDYDQKNRKQTISFDLERQERFPNPAWRVIWGESIGTSGLSVLVDASTGLYLQTLH